MDDEKKESSNLEIRRITNVGIALNLLLSGFKITVGVLGNSIALVADGIHSLSDIATDIVVLIGVYFGSKKADLSHPYGHGKIETFSAIGIALTLVFVGVGMIYKASVNITDFEFIRPGACVLVVAMASVVSKEWLYRASKKIAVTTHSPVLYANAWHHRSDALSSIAVVVGFILMVTGFKYGDRIAAMVVGYMIVRVGGRMIFDSFQELIEGTVDEETVELIKSIINSNSSVRHWHKLRTRMVGREVFLDLHILVDPELSIAAAHEIAENLESALHEQITRPVNITVHIEPDVPGLRK
ncbi:MAG: cation diffusion facilitator family transporter [Planctomycetota bacterium]|jgi:cation diffusion facilitator family transporter